MKKWLLFWIYFAGIGSVTGFVLLLFYNLSVFLNIEEYWTNHLVKLALADVTGFPLIALGFHIWSVLYLNYSVQQEGARKSHACPYCGEQEAGPVLCNQCQSIQWNRLGLLQAVAVFTAQHRWQLLTAFFFLFLATPLSFIYTLKKEKENLLEQKRELLRQGIDNINKVRSLLIGIESGLTSAMPPQTYDEKYYEMTYRYMQFTWEISDRLSPHMKINRQQFPEWNYAYSTIQDALKNRDSEVPNHLKGKNGFDPIAIVTFFVEDDLIDINYMEDFRSYCDAYKNWQSQPNNLNLISARKNAASVLLERLKITNVVLSTIISGGFASDLVAMRYNVGVWGEYCQQDSKNLIIPKPILDTVKLRENYNL